MAGAIIVMTPVGEVEVLHNLSAAPFINRFKEAVSQAAINRAAVYAEARGEPMERLELNGWDFHQLEASLALMPKRNAAQQDIEKAKRASGVPQWGDTIRVPAPPIKPATCRICGDRQEDITPWATFVFPLGAKYDEARSYLCGPCGTKVAEYITHLQKPMLDEEDLL